MEGWIKLHRKIAQHWIYKNSDYVKAWICILITVNYEDKKVLIHGELIECKRSQSLLSLLSWAKLFGKNWTIQKVRTFFELLKSDSMIHTEGLPKTTRLTVCNYDDYQTDQQTDNTQITFKQQTDNTQITTTKEVKKLRSKEVKNKEEELIKEIDILPEFKEPFKNWLQFKRLRGESYKDKQSTSLAYKKLLKLSGNNLIRAVQIIEESMANNYAGLFPLKQEKNGSQPQNQTIEVRFEK
jgi:hypothetical protein